MTIVLISPPSNVVEDDRLEPHLGLLYIAAVLLSAGLDDVVYYDMTGCLNEDEVEDKLKGIPVGCVYGISCYSTNCHYVKKLLEKLKTTVPESLIVIGGAHPTAMPHRVLDDLGADAVVAGEGEDAFLKLVIEFLRNGTKKRGVFFGKGRTDIDSYPFPARHLADNRTYSRKMFGQPVVSVLSSRGCWYNCVHCNSVVMGGGNRFPRYRTTGNIVDEIRNCRNEFAYYRFNDDNFTGNPGLSDLLVELKGLEIKYRIFARVEDLTEDNCEKLAESGCQHISVGLESLEPNNLKFLGKEGQVGQESMLKNAKKYGLLLRASFMVGLPFDNEGSIRASFERASELGIDEYAIYPLIPYPGTRIAERPSDYGYRIVEHDFTKYVQMGRNAKTCFALEHRNFSLEQVEKWVELGAEILSRSAIHMRESMVI